MSSLERKTYGGEVGYSERTCKRIKGILRKIGSPISIYKFICPSNIVC